MSQDPNQTPYGTPQDPYSTPPSNPYGAQQPQNPYSTPAPQNPYGAPQDPYSGPSGTSSSYPQVANAPLPLGEAIKQLPSQYLKVTTKPSAATIAEELGKASWDIVWVQLLGLAIITTILSYLSANISANSYAALGSNSGMDPAAIRSLTAGTSFGSIILIPLGFFISVGIIYLIAKAFKGDGTFLRQSYGVLLWQVPLTILSSLLAFIPLVGGLAALAIGIYEIVLNVFTVQAVHRLSGGKATAVVLIPLAVAVVIGCGLLFLLIGIIAAALGHRNY